jgi:sugar (pentulose or hexulose) kinase
MTAALGIDLGTTTITALALDLATGDILARATAPNRAESPSTADRGQGRSEWDAQVIARIACSCLAEVAKKLGGRVRDMAGLGITGQQHGGVIVDGKLRPLTPFIGWQDRRGEEAFPGSTESFVSRALDLAGADAPERAGCRLAAGYLAVTLFWLKENGLLPRMGTACFLMDYFAALLTGLAPVTDPSSAASSGVLNLRTRNWDAGLITALGLPVTAFPEVRPSGELLGPLTPESARATGLPAGLPVLVGIGDNQASFLGSVADREEAVLVNVGTGGQVVAWTQKVLVDPLLETRPFPSDGFLLVCAGLCGGRSYAALESFFRQVGFDFFGVQHGPPLF